jgi:hypothetical protein
MLRFIDGVDHYATVDINAKWSNSAGVTVGVGSGRFGGNCLRLGDLASGSFAQKTLDDQASWVVGLAFLAAGFPAAPAPIVRLLDRGVNQVELRVNPDGTLTVTRNGTPVAGGISSMSLRVGSYYFIEFKATIGAAIAANSCLVNVNGATVLTVTAGQDLQNTANTTANAVAIHGTTANCCIDDIYICDGSGAVNSDFLGDCRILTIFPNAAGDKSEWTLSGIGLTDHFQAVNETTPDGDLSYVANNVTGQTDLFQLQDLSLSGTIRGVQLNLYARKDDAGPLQLAGVVKSGGTEYAGPTFNPATSYLVFHDIRETDPATGAPWTLGGINAAQAGIKVV